MLRRKRNGLAWWAPVTLGALLWHCSLDSGGRSSEGDAAGSGLSPGYQGAGGSSSGQGGGVSKEPQPNGDGGGGPTQGAGGSSVSAGAGGVGGVGGSSAAAGSGGSGGTAGAGGIGGTGGSAGAGGSGPAGASGSGGGGVPCTDDGDFEVKSAPGSCFFVLVQPSSFDHDEAKQACADFGAGMGALSSVDEYNDVVDEVETFITGDIWLGARAPSGGQGNPSAFTWENGEPWQFNSTGVFPWGQNFGADEPTNLFGELCVEMNRDGSPSFSMNNISCGNGPSRVLCERK
jgi:hypothetical protein